MFGHGRILLKLILVTFTLHSAVNATDDTQLREILNKHWEAMGGMRNWSQVESIRLNGTIERDGQTVDIVIVKKRPDQIRATVTLPIPGKEDEKLQVIRAHDGKTAWTATRLAGAPEMKKEILPLEASNELLADAGVLPRVIKLWRQGFTLSKLPPQTIDGVGMIVIESSSEESDEKEIFYLAHETHLLIQHLRISPDGTTQTTYDDYRKLRGVMIPHTLKIDSEKTGNSILSTSSAQIGVGIYEEYFEISPMLETAILE